MLAPCFNNELLDRRDIAATTVIFTGATLAVMFGNKGTPEYSLDDLLALYRAPLTSKHQIFHKPHSNPA